MLFRAKDERMGERWGIWMGVGEPEVCSCRRQPVLPNAAGRGEMVLCFLHPERKAG